LNERVVQVGLNLAQVLAAFSIQQYRQGAEGRAYDSEDVAELRTRICRKTCKIVTVVTTQLQCLRLVSIGYD
jgi:hypothetical protein